MDDHLFQNMVDGDFEDHINMYKKMAQDADFQNAIKGAAKLMEDTVQHDGALYFCGNGGSAADSQHIATEFVSRFYKERRAINAEALTVNTSSLTAIGNDYDFKRVFARQVEAKGKKGDTLVGISTSGTSPNVIEALEYAARIGMHTILLTGGRELKAAESAYDCVIRVPSTDTPRIQEAHIFIGHVLAEYIEHIVAEEG